jgi:hypothetical protein
MNNKIKLLYPPCMIIENQFVEEVDAHMVQKVPGTFPSTMIRKGSKIALRLSSSGRNLVRVTCLHSILFSRASEMDTNSGSRLLYRS